MTDSADKESGVWFFVCGIIIGILIMLIIWSSAAIGQDNSWRDQIVERGCAEYYLDANHDRQWRWKAPKAPTAPSDKTLTVLPCYP